MKKIAVIFVLIILPAFFYSQNATLDSLLQLYNNAPDTTKLRLLFSIAWEYRGIDTDKSIYYYNEGIRLADKLNNQKAYKIPFHLHIS